MKTQSLVAALATILVSTLFCSAVGADALTGVKDITLQGKALVSIRHGGTEYVVAQDDLMLGTTTRWYILTAGVPTLWKEGDAAPAATVANASDPKRGDVGSNADDWIFDVSGAVDGISSIDGINYQETVFALPTKLIFVFERGGNDNGTVQAILPDGSLGKALTLTANGVPYVDTGVNVGGQNAFGYALATDVPVKGIRITAPGHDAFTVAAARLRLDPKQSRDPQPADKAADVTRDVVLSWTAGEDATAHDVYLGTSVADVNNASRANPRGALISQGQTAPTSDPAALEFGKTYYWRVDEVSGGGATIFKGAVWSFAVEPYAYPIPNVTASASSVQPGMGPENTVNGSGLNAEDQHSTEIKQMWMSAGVLPNWIQYQFDQVHKLHEMWVWNSNQQIETFVGFGAKNVTVEYSVDGSTWTALAGVPEFARATGDATYTHSTTVSFGGVRAQYVRLTINTTWGGVPQSGLSEVRFLSIPVQARQPLPADAGTGVSPDVTLTWRPGREAASHQVYFGKDKNAVAKGTVAATAVTDASFTPAGLGFGATYYWRVDEVGGAGTTGVYEGPVWSFATQEYGVVDDFESYTDQAGAEVFTAWVDGYGTQTNGSQVGNLQAQNGTFGETQIVHGGKQSMPLLYNNTGGFSLSEAERTFDTAQDWTAAGIATLTVYFRGDPNSTGGKLYLKINGVKVAYNGDAAAVKSASWTRWDVALASVNTNLKKVTRLAIGLESGGTGVLYVDNIRLLPGATAPAITIAVGPATSVKATGNDGTIQSINGIDVSGLVLGKTTTDYEKYPDHPAAHADDFNLGTYASLDEAKAITVKFTVPVTTVFIVERGGNDSGFVQALDAAGNPLGEPQPFATANWLKVGATIGGQAAGAIAITASTPFSGITLLPPAGGVTGVDPASISAVPAK